jgi:hypothetical protein
MRPSRERFVALTLLVLCASCGKGDVGARSAVAPPGQEAGVPGESDADVVTPESDATAGDAGIASAADASGAGPGSGDGGGNLPPRGMSAPWVEQQAEDGRTNATILGPSRVKWDANHIEAEAIGRKAVRLANTGDYVAFTTTAAANSVVVRFSIPDSAGGGGIDATLGLYINGARAQSLALTSRYSWSYDGAVIGSASVETPGPQPHTFFDEVRLLTGEIPVGAEVKLQKDAQDGAAFYVIDLVDFEEAPPPLDMPAGFTPITQFGVVPDDGKDHANDILAAMKMTSKLWFPKGDYLAESLSGGNVGLDNPGIEVRGAGMWYTVLRGPKALFFCDGASSKCVFGDFSIFGEAKARDEETAGVQKAFAGPMGTNSLIENVWIEHEVGAIWVGNDPPNQQAPTQGLTIRNCRIRDTYADGINLDNGTSTSLVENCHMRNTGDDAATVWSIKWTDWVKYQAAMGTPVAAASQNAPDQGVAHGNTFQNISVQMPWRGSCFAAYGGNDNHWKDSTCEDVLTYPGIFADREFSPYPFGSALTTFENMSVVRAGGEMFLENSAAGPWRHGAVKFSMREGDVNDVLVQDVDVVDPTYEGIEFRGFGTTVAATTGTSDPPYVLMAADMATLHDVTLKNVKVTGAGTYGIQVNDDGGRGTVTFESVTVSGSMAAALDPGGAPASFFDKVSGNGGW